MYTCMVGTGKSETAYKMADILLERKNRLQYTDYRIAEPRGLLVLRGEEFSEAVYHGVYRVCIGCV